MHATDIAGYTYNTDMFCEHCIAVGFEREHGPSIFEGAEAILDARATELGIDRYDESSFDSGEFPKVVFVSQLEDDECCGGCHELLI